MRGILKKAAAGLLAAAALSGLSGCALFGGDQGLNQNPVRTYDYSAMKLVQLEEPHEGQPTVTFETDAGNIMAVLYPEYAPNTVNNFTARVNDGFYDGQDIYGILDGEIFMSGAADEKKDSGVTEDGQLIANELSVDLWTFRGAICAYNGRSGYGDSRFFVINQHPLSEEDIAELKGLTDENGGKLLPDELIDAFIEKGCIAGFAGRYTVFAQTIEGFDVIEKICASEVSGDLYAPTTPIRINKVTLGEYHAVK